MKTMTRIMSAVALAAMLPATSSAGVWDDCVLWYNGGAVDANGDGKFTNGEMLDIRHAGIADSPTHGGTLMNSTAERDTVRIATNEVVFPMQNSRKLQCPVLDFTAPVVTNGAEATSNGSNITNLGNIVQIPNVLPTTSDTYTALIRFRCDSFYPWTDSYQTVIDLGRNGASNVGRGVEICLSADPSDKKLRLAYMGNPKQESGLSLTSAKDGWHEVAVVANGTSLTVGIVETNHNISAAMRWNTITVGAGALKPYYSTLKLGGRKEVPAQGKTLFRGQIHMVSFWNRALTESEVMEAFSYAPPPSAPSLPSIFQVGFPNVDGSEIFAGAPGPATITAAPASPEDWRKLPASFLRDESVNISFMLDAKQTNLPQVVRLVPRAGTSGNVSVLVNGVFCGTKNVRGGVESYVYVPVECLAAAGENVCTIIRTDAGADALGFNAVQMFGSWRIGYDDDKWTDMGGAGATEADFYIEWSSQDWNLFRRAVLTNNNGAYPLNVHLGDILGRWGNNRYVYTWKLQKNSGSDASMVVKLNGSTLNVKSNGSDVACPVPLTDTEWHTYSIELDESNLVRGADNVLTWENSGSTFYGFDYHELAVRNLHRGLVITLR